MIDILMYTLYIVLGIAPFSIVRIYPFREKMRVNPKIFWSIYSSVLVFEVIWFISIVKNGPTLFVSNSELLRMFFYFIYFLISVIFIKESPSKHLIVWSVCIIFSSTFTAFTFCMDTMFPSSIPFLIKNITMIFLLPPFLWFSFVFINNQLMVLINQSTKKINRLISALLILIIVIGLITARELPYNAARPWTVFGVRLLVAGTTVIICYIYYSIIKEQKRIQQMIEDNKQKEKMLEVSTQQFKALSDKIDETKRTRHDLKFHVSAIKNFIKNQEYENLLQYIETDNLLPNYSVLSFCSHPTLNILFSYYSDIAKSNNIDFEVSANVKSEIFITSNEIWVLLGNLLENAIEATKNITDQQKIIKIKMIANELSLVLTVDNPFDENQIKRSADGFLTTKEKGGVGLESVSFLAEKHHGLATFETQSTWFLSSVTMYK